MLERQVIAFRLMWIAIFCVTCTRGYADSFDTFGDYEKLSEHVVLAAGNVSDFLPTEFSLDDPLQSQKARFYQIGNFCFGWGLGGELSEDITGKAALLLIDKLKTASLAELSTSVSQIKVTVKPVILYDCGSILKSQGDKLKRQLELQLQRNRNMMEILKSQQQRQQ